MRRTLPSALLLQARPWDQIPTPGLCLLRPMHAVPHPSLSDPAQGCCPALTPCQPHPTLCLSPSQRGSQVWLRMSHSAASRTPRQAWNSNFQGEGAPEPPG